jgi:hypothetical protein
MKIIIEGKEADFEIKETSKVSWQQVVGEAETFLLSVGKVPIGLSINGKEYSQEEFQKIEENLLKGDEVIEFQTTSLGDFLLSTLDGIGTANKDLVTRLKAFSKDLSAKSASPESMKIFDELNSFFGFWVKLHALMPKPLHQIPFSEGSLKDFLSKLHDVIKDIVESMDKDDFVLASDLMSYELIPAIQTIDEVIPRLSEALRDWKKKIA